MIEQSTLDAVQVLRLAHVPRSWTRRITPLLRHSTRGLVAGVMTEGKALARTASVAAGMVCAVPADAPALTKRHMCGEHVDTGVVLDVCDRPLDDAWTVAHFSSVTGH